MTLGRALLTLSRGLTFGVDSCKGWIFYQLIFSQVLTFSVEVVLVMRCEYRVIPPLIGDDNLFYNAVYILYSQNKVILAMILFALLAEVSVMVTILAISLASPLLQFSPSCLVSGIPSIFVGFWYALNILPDWVRH